MTPVQRAARDWYTLIDYRGSMERLRFWRSCGLTPWTIVGRIEGRVINVDITGSFSQ